MFCIASVYDLLSALTYALLGALSNFDEVIVVNERWYGLIFFIDLFRILVAI